MVVSRRVIDRLRGGFSHALFSDDEKTSSVRLLRFELSPEMASKVESGSSVRVGIDHPSDGYEVQLSSGQRDSLAADLA